MSFDLHNESPTLKQVKPKYLSRPVVLELSAVERSRKLG
jgi:hypothetical protein